MHEYIELGPGLGVVEPALIGAADVTPDGDAASDDIAGGTGGGELAGDSLTPGATFSIDRDTTRPDRVSYSDPFTPTVVPFKRAVVYDAVNASADLLVRDKALKPVATLTQARPNDEHFHASLDVELRAGERTAIPSVAPGARLVVAHADPPVAFRIGIDSAENWFVEAAVTERVRLTLQVVADQRVFGSPLRDASWAELAPKLVPLPDEVKKSALDVARALGVDDVGRPRRAVESLVEHFRRFSPSERKPSGNGLSLYRELALTARGICRHRAYAFMITALGLGVPTRVAMNEAHAWVEVFDGELWHRIDLGGAAERLDMDDEGRPRHVEPPDPFTWPDRSESGLAMAERRVEDAPPGARSAASPTDSESDLAAPSGDVPAGSPLPEERPPEAPGLEPAPGQPLEPAPPPEAPLDPQEEPRDNPRAPELGALPPGSVTLNTADTRAERGKGLFVSGEVRDAGQRCSGANIEILLGQSQGANIALGTLVSDARGEFRGHLVIPWHAHLGEHTLIAVAKGHCLRRVETR